MAFIGREVSGGLVCDGAIAKYELAIEANGKLKRADRQGAECYAVASKDHVDGEPFQGYILHLSLVVELKAKADIAANIDRVTTTDDGRAEAVASGDHAIGFIKGGAAIAGDQVFEVFVLQSRLP